MPRIGKLDQRARQPIGAKSGIDVERLPVHVRRAAQPEVDHPRRHRVVGRGVDEDDGAVEAALRRHRRLFAEQRAQRPGEERADKVGEHDLHDAARAIGQRRVVMQEVAATFLEIGARAVVL